MTADLEHLNEIWNRAWLEKNVTLVENLIADDYVYIAPNGCCWIARPYST
jgi:hypothetical protein